MKHWILHFEVQERNNSRSWNFFFFLEEERYSFSGFPRCFATSSIHADILRGLFLLFRRRKNDIFDKCSLSGSAGAKGIYVKLDTAMAEVVDGESRTF